MTTDRTGPVLDLERLDAAADEALAGVRLDLGAVRARAAVAAGHRRGRRWMLAAVAAVVLLLAAAGASGLGALRSAPQPAVPVTGPGALPRVVHAVPRLLTSVADAPIGRVALVLAGPVNVVGLRMYSGVGPVLVAADGGAYRRLPVTDGVGAVSLSGDGRVVAWADYAPFVEGTDPGALDGAVRWVDVATGRTGRASFGYASGVVAGVERTTTSPDGGRVVVWVTRRVDAAEPGVRTTDMWAVDTASGATTSLCRVCDRSVAYDGAGRFLAEDGLDADGLLAPPGRYGAPQAQFFTSVQAFASADGARRLVLDKDRPQELGPPAPYRLVEVDGSGNAVSTTDLGTLQQASILAWHDRTAWVSVRPDGQGSDVVRRVTLGGGWTEVLPRNGSPGSAFDPLVGPGLPAVVALAADVVAAGRTADTAPPTGVPWWSPASAWLFLSERPAVLGAVGLLLLGGIVVAWREVVRRRRPPRTSAAPADTADATDGAR